MFITLNREFYNRDSLTVAKELLGKTLVHETGGVTIKAKIVETEAYMGVTDRAAHSYGGRRTPRVEVMYGDPGHSYVYLIYGMYHCLNTVTNAPGTPEAVLIRAAEPTEGFEYMAAARYGKPYASLNEKQKRGLTNGPGKLCDAFAISRTQNGLDLCSSRLYIADTGQHDFKITRARRVGIDYAGEAKEYLWRFYMENNGYVSVQ